MGKSQVCTPGLIHSIPRCFLFAACSCTLTGKHYWIRVPALGFPSLSEPHWRSARPRLSHSPARAALLVGSGPLHPKLSQGKGCSSPREEGHPESSLLCVCRDEGCPNTASGISEHGKRTCCYPRPCQHGLVGIRQGHGRSASWSSGRGSRA